MSSFANERTIEYSLVPILRNALSLEFRRVIPLFPWIAREGSKTAANQHALWQGRVLAFFARRPKVDEPGYIRSRINSELYSFAHYAFDLGIPTIAGLPLVDSLYSLDPDSKVLWLLLNRQKDSDFDFKVSLHGNFFSATADEDSCCTVLGIGAIGCMLRDVGPVITWREMMDRLQYLRSVRNASSMWPWHAGYRPVYFLASND
jgi:hypothetical protein